MADMISTREAMDRAYDAGGDCGLYRALGWAYRGGVAEVDWAATQSHEPTGVPPLPDDDGDDIEHIGAVARNGGASTIRARS
jgi:hypothetical protein